jgi:hypothetical protein
MMEQCISLVDHSSRIRGIRLRDKNKIEVLNQFKVSMERILFKLAVVISIALL